MNWKVLGVGLAVAVPLIAVLAAGFGKDPHHIESPLIGKAAPAFSLPSLTGETVNPTGPMVVNFWATWCVPCRTEHRELVRAAAAWEGRVTFYGVVYQDKVETIEGWLAQHGGANYPTLVDEGGKTAIAFGVYGVPETFVVDAAGIVRRKFTGPVTAGQLAEELAKL